MFALLSNFPQLYYQFKLAILNSLKTDIHTTQKEIILAT